MQRAKKLLPIVRVLSCYKTVDVGPGKMAVTQAFPVPRVPLASKVSSRSPLYVTRSVNVGGFSGYGGAWVPCHLGTWKRIWTAVLIIHIVCHLKEALYVSGMLRSSDQLSSKSNLRLVYTL